MLYVSAKWPHPGEKRKWMFIVAEWNVHRGWCSGLERVLQFLQASLPLLPPGLHPPALLSWAQTPQSRELPSGTSPPTSPYSSWLQISSFLPAEMHLLAASAYSFSSAPQSYIILKSNSYSIWQWLKYWSNHYLLLPVLCRQELNYQTLARISEILTPLNLSLWKQLTFTAQKCYQLFSCLILGKIYQLLCAFASSSEHWKW